MSTKIYIFGERGLWRNRSDGYLHVLHRDLRDFLQSRGEIIFDGENEGPQWNVDLRVHDDAENVDGWVQRLTTFLREWGVMDRELCFTIIRCDTKSIWEFRRVQISES